MHLTALVAGMIYSFTPAHIAWSMGFRGATHIEWIPLTILFLLRFFRKPTTGNAFFSFFFLFLMRGESHFFAAFVLSLIPFLIFQFRQHRDVVHSHRFKRIVLAAIGVGAVVTAIVYFPLLRVSFSDNNYLDLGIKTANTYTNDIFSAVVPPFTNTILGDQFASFRKSFSGNKFENSAYVGFTVLLLIFFALSRARIKNMYFWLAIGISFYVVSTGPFLHVHGIVNPKVPMPYLLIYNYVPFFQNIRSVDRFAIIALLAFVIVAAYGLYALLSTFRKSAPVILLSVGILGAVIFEYFPTPIPTQSLAYPSFYDELKNEEGDLAILEIPGATNYQAASRFAYYQTTHRKDMINFYQPARVNTQDERYRRMVDTPLYRELLFERVRNSDLPAYSAFDMTNPDVTTATLNADHVRYIIIHKDSIGDESDELSSSSYAGLRSFLLQEG